MTPGESFDTGDTVSDLTDGAHVGFDDGRSGEAVDLGFKFLQEVAHGLLVFGKGWGWKDASGVSGIKCLEAGADGCVPDLASKTDAGATDQLGVDLGLGGDGAAIAAKK